MVTRGVLGQLAACRGVDEVRIDYPYVEPDQMYAALRDWPLLWTSVRR